jgi:hypothetical protein
MTGAKIYEKFETQSALKLFDVRIAVRTDLRVDGPE